MTRAVEAKFDLVNEEGLPLRVLVNPEPRPFAAFFKRSKERKLRGFVYQNDVIWWDAYEAIHGTVARQLGWTHSIDYLDFRLETYQRDGLPFVDIPIWDAEKIRPMHKLFRSDDILFDGRSFGPVSWSEYQEALKRHPQYANSVTARLARLFPVTAMPRKVVPKDAAVPDAVADLPKKSGCAIFSMSVALDKPISQVWAKARPRFNEGMVTGSIRNTLLEFKVGVRPLKAAEGKAFATVMSAFGRVKGSFLVFTPNHVVGIKDGRFVDTGNTPDNAVVHLVWQLVPMTAKDRLIGKYVMGDVKQNGTTYRVPGIMTGENKVFVWTKSGEGLIAMKNVVKLNGPTPPELQARYVAYMKKYGTIV